MCRRGLTTVLFALSAEQVELRQVVRRLLSREGADAGRQAGVVDEKLWRRMSAELGLQGIAVPETYGGGGFGAVELGIVVEELGRALLPGPFFGTVAATATVLTMSQDDVACRRWLPRIVTGDLLATVALPQPGAAVEVTGTASPVGWTVEGVLPLVLDADAAQLLVVPARTGTGLSLMAVEPGPGVLVEPLPSLDPTRRWGRVQLNGAPAALVGVDGAAVDILERATAAILVLLGAEQLGVAVRALEMATEHVKIRHQFGRPLGSFQSVKHRLATVLVELEAARAAVMYGLLAVANDSEELPKVASIVKSHCSETAYLAAADCLQLHGGIGFTWEHPAHLYFKRATSDRLWLGDPAWHRQRLAELAGLD